MSYLKMSSIGNFFYLILYQPLFNVLVLLCKYLPWRDLGLAIIILTVLIKLALYPLGAKAIKSQKALALIQPKIKEIQEKFKSDKEAQGREMLALYKREKINLVRLSSKRYRANKINIWKETPVLKIRAVFLVKTGLLRLLCQIFLKTNKASTKKTAPTK